MALPAYVPVLVGQYSHCTHEGRVVLYAHCVVSARPGVDIRIISWAGNKRTVQHMGID